MGKWITPREQTWAPSGAHFHQFVVPPILNFRKDCTYGDLAAMKLPDDVEGLGCCEVTNQVQDAFLIWKLRIMNRDNNLICKIGSLTHPSLNGERIPDKDKDGNDLNPYNYGWGMDGDKYISNPFLPWSVLSSLYSINP